jgi:hypothetical protein
VQGEGAATSNNAVVSRPRVLKHEIGFSIFKPYEGSLRRYSYIEYDDDDTTEEILDESSLDSPLYVVSRYTRRK